MNRTYTIICFLILCFGTQEGKNMKLRSNKLDEKLIDIKSENSQINNTNLRNKDLKINEKMGNDTQNSNEIISLLGVYTGQKYKIFLQVIKIVNYVAYLLILFYIIGLIQRKHITKRIWKLFCTVYCCSCCKC